MKTLPKQIFCEYKSCEQFKTSLGSKGLCEQGKINERFYRGDQWYGVPFGAERPLVRHNVIKRIGDFKMSQILSSIKPVKYTVDNLVWLENDRNDLELLKGEVIKKGAAAYKEEPDNAELALVSTALSKNRELCANRLRLDNIFAKALKDSYVTGTGIVYTFWDENLKGKTGDIGCEVLSVNDVFFADPYEKNLQNQPFIIISGSYNTDRVIRQAKQYGCLDAEQIIKDSHWGKVTVLTKLYKEFDPSGKERVMCVKVTENAVIRKPFSTMLKNYPIALFCFEERDDIIYGDSEVTYLIPNQIAINRMITANVWSSMSTGMPIMVVNGDIVTSEITNDPGQIIKVYGSNEDVKGAVNFVSPRDYSNEFCQNINNLIHNTLTQSGATSAVLGDEVIDNATAISYLKGNAVMSLKVSSERFCAFVKSVAEIWGDFFMTYYNERFLKFKEGKNVYMIPFSKDRYKNAVLIVEDDLPQIETDENHKTEGKS